MSDNEDKIAKLEAEVEALKAAQPKPQKTWAEIERENAEHRDWVHQMRERQANSWMPPDAIREMVAAEPRGFMQGVVRDNRAIERNRKAYNELISTLSARSISTPTSTTTDFTSSTSISNKPASLALTKPRSSRIGKMQ